MTISDPIGDMLTRIRNAQMKLHPTVLIPSSKFKKFVLDIEIEEKYSVKNITQKSFDPDFKNSKIHHCYQIRHK